MTVASASARHPQPRQSDREHGSDEGEERKKPGKHCKNRLSVLGGDRDDDEDDDTDDGQGPELPCQPAPVRASKRRVRADLVGHGGRR